MQETNETTPTRAVHYPKRHGRNLALLVTAAGLAAGGFLAVQAIAGTQAYRHVQAAAFDDGGWRGRDHKPLAEMSEAEVADHVERIVRHVAIEIDATREQEDRILSLVGGLAADIKPLAERMQATGGELSGLLTATTVDRAALERLRAARLAEADRISKTLLDMIAEVAEVLTPEQRATLAEMMRERREARGHRRRG